MIARRQAGLRERAAHALLRTVMDASPIPLVVTDVDNGERLYSTHAGNARSVEQLSERFLDPTRQTEYTATLLRTEAVDDVPWRMTGKDGRPREMLVSARLLEHDGRRVAICAFRDVTELRLMETEIARQRETAHQTERLSALGELLTAVAHEFSNPLFIVSANVAMLLERELDVDTATRRRIERTASAAERCVRIVRTFLGMARARPVEIAPTPLHELVAVTLDVLGGGIEERGASVEVSIPSDLPLVAADAERLQQVLANLFVNADQAISDLGADDYLGKPVDLRELEARVKAVLRRHGEETGPRSAAGYVPIGAYTLDLDSARLTSPDGQDVAITATDFGMLRTFAENRGRVLSRDQLLDEAHDHGWEPFDRPVDLRISRLRRKLAASDPPPTRSVRGLAYVLD